MVGRFKEREGRRPGGPGRRGTEARTPKPSEDGNVETIFGYRASLAVCERRPNDVVSIAVASELAPEESDFLEWAEGEGIPIAVNASRELTRLAGSDHHEGLVVVARPRTWLTPQALLDVIAAAGGVAIALDRVRNPYNIGAILRTAAFFGVEGALLGAPAPHPGLAGDAVRVAEGGAEHLAFARTTDLAESLRRFRARGVAVVAADTEGKGVLDAHEFAFERPLVLVVGNEREGLSDRILEACSTRVTLRGTGKIESLNVSVATSLLIGEACRARRVK